MAYLLLISIGPVQEFIASAGICGLVVASQAAQRQAETDLRLKLPKP